jgi:hypothetical protein
MLRRTLTPIMITMTTPGTTMPGTTMPGMDMPMEGTAITIMRRPTAWMRRSRSAPG